MFTESEKAFLCREHASMGLREFPLIDPSTLRNREQSLRVINRILEARAAKLGSLFEAFRQEQAAAKPKRTPSLEQKISASKLW